MPSNGNGAKAHTVELGGDNFQSVVKTAFKRAVAKLTLDRRHDPLLRDAFGIKCGDPLPTIRVAWRRGLPNLAEKLKRYKCSWPA